MIERGWAAATDAPDFWNPKLRAPHCFNAVAARSFLPIYLMRTKLILAGKSKEEMLRTTEAAFKSGALPKLEPGALVYMMSREQYLGDGPEHWHPHVMFYVPLGEEEQRWGANLAGSPVIATPDPEEHATVLILVAGHWSDGSAAMMH